MSNRNNWPGITRVSPVTPYMSPNFLPTAGRYARSKDLGLQIQMERAWNDRYANGTVWDDNPNGAVWDLDPRPQRFESEFPPAPEYDALDAWLDADDALYRGVFGSAAEAPERKKSPDLQKFKEAVFDLVKKKGPLEKAQAEVREALAPAPQPPLIIQTPAQQQADTTKTILAAGGFALAAFGVGYVVGSKWGR